MAKFTCPTCGKTFEKNYWKWLFTAIFHKFSFKELRDYRKTKCPYCGTKTYMKKH